VLDLETWAEIRRMRFVERLSIREIARRTGHDRKTVQRAIRSDAPPRYGRAPHASKLDPFKDEIERLLRADPRLPGTRVRELLGELGYGGGKTILDDYLREVRPRTCRGRGPSSARSTVPARSSSSTCSGCGGRFPWVTARPARAAWF
jgi:transposase